MVLDVSDFGAALAKERGSVFHEGALALPMKRRGSGVIAEWALISLEDRHLARHSWSINANGYPSRRRPGVKNATRLSMAREVMGVLDAGPKVVVDHINRDKTDNRRENLRICTQAQNCQNQGSKPGSSSRFRGVSRDKSRGARGAWVANITINGKQYYLGRFDREEDAADAAARARAERMTHTVE